MAILANIFIFLFSASVIWFFAGLLIELVDRVARRFNKSGFVIAFFLLGFLTPIGEISIAVNSTIGGVPQVSVGNLVGSSFVILLFIVPFLAAVGNKIELRHTLSGKNLQLALIAIILPVLLVIDGNVTRRDGLLALIVYATLLFAIRRQKDSPKEVKLLTEEDLLKKTATTSDYLKIIFGAVLIFIAGHFLVEQAVYFADLLSVPSSLVGLILLSIGTNVPEMVIAVRSIAKKHKDIAFGTYVGSATANTLIFGLLAFTNGGFAVEPSEFGVTATLMFFGLTLFYFFARSKNIISRNEGFVLLSFYFVFLLVQILNVLRFSAQ